MSTYYKMLQELPWSCSYLEVCLSVCMSYRSGVSLCLLRERRWVACQSGWDPSESKHSHSPLWKTVTPLHTCTHKCSVHTPSWIWTRTNKHTNTHTRILPQHWEHSSHLPNGTNLISDHFFACRGCSTYTDAQKHRVTMRTQQQQSCIFSRKFLSGKKKKRFLCYYGTASNIKNHSYINMLKKTNSCIN